MGVGADQIGQSCALIPQASMDRIQRQTGVAAVVLPGLAEGKTGAAAAVQRHVTGEGKGGLAHIEINHCRLFGSFQLVGAVLLGNAARRAHRLDGLGLGEVIFQGLGLHRCPAGRPPAGSARGSAGCRPTGTFQHPVPGSFGQSSRRGTDGRSVQRSWGRKRTKFVAVQGVVLRHREGPVHRVADGIVGGAVPAVGQIPAAIDFKQIGALQHVLGLGCKDGPAEGPVGQVGGSVFDHHAAQGVLMSSHQHPVALLVLVPEDFRVPEIIGGIVFRRIEGIFRQLGPGDLVAADRVHHAFLAGAKGRGVSLIVAGVETVVQPVLPQQDRTGAQSQIRVAEVPVRDHFPVVLIFVEIFGGKAIDRVIGWPLWSVS